MRNEFVDSGQTERLQSRMLVGAALPRVSTGEALAAVTATAGKQISAMATNRVLTGCRGLWGLSNGSFCQESRHPGPAAAAAAAAAAATVAR